MKVHGTFMKAVEGITAALASGLVTCAVVAIGGLSFLWTAVCLAMSLCLVVQASLWLIVRHESPIPTVAGLAGITLAATACTLATVLVH